MKSIADNLVKAAKTLSAAVGSLGFGLPVTHFYNPLDYAWSTHELYLRTYGNSRKRIVFLGMNPGPFGMVQTGVPFGEITIIRDWLKIEGPLGKPAREHPKRPVLGFDCQRSEVSGRRLWNLFRARFGSVEDFFTGHFVLNYCPLAFFEASGRNRTPDKLPLSESAAVFTACDAHLCRVISILQPEWVIGIGCFAEQRARGVLPSGRVRIGRILHPSPASPSANRDWEGKVTGQLKRLGVWP